MAIIEGFRVQNYRALKDVALGRLWNLQGAKPLTPLTAVIGRNGVGKSTLFDAFGFISDCIKLGVEDACDAKGRGGFKRLISQGTNNTISFDIYYRESSNSRPITYEVSIGVDSNDRPYVLSERLRQRRGGQSRGRPFSFLILNNGRGVVWKGDNAGVDEEAHSKDLVSIIEEAEREESNETEIVELEDKRHLGIVTLGALKQHPRISAFRRFIEGWYLSYFSPDAARGIPLAGPQKHLNVHGDNLGNVVQYMQREHPRKFGDILKSIAQKIPGVDKIETEPLIDGRLALKFNDRSFVDPFFAQQMSDGTLKVFAYLLLLADPTPPPFLCVEEPENGLYHKLFDSLVESFREHATGKKGGSQIFVTTHQPYFVDALQPDEVWILEKGTNGFSTIRRASNDPLVQELVNEGLPLGGLWYSDYLEGTQDAF
jgi:predicted ATPase